MEYFTPYGAADIGSDPYGISNVGPKSDGTFGIPTSAGAVTPYDAGGGPSANYGAQIMDVFKFGVGVWQQQQNQTAMLDYKRFEATQNGLYQQGKPANLYSSANGGNSNQLIFFALLIGGVILLAKD